MTKQEKSLNCNMNNLTKVHNFKIMHMKCHWMCFCATTLRGNKWPTLKHTTIYVWHGHIKRFNVACACDII
jgi:hypothetical protein